MGATVVQRGRADNQKKKIANLNVGGTSCKDLHKTNAAVSRSICVPTVKHVEHVCVWETCFTDSFFVFSPFRPPVYKTREKTTRLGKKILKKNKETWKNYFFCFENINKNAETGDCCDTVKRTKGSVGQAP